MTSQFKYTVNIISQVDGKTDSTNTLENMIFANPVNKGDFLKVFLNITYPSPEIPLTLGRVMCVDNFAAHGEKEPFTFVKILRDIKDERYQRYVKEYQP